jgi:chemosensory pili system protein ChpA (sensor histidine kinase/response regulator)
VTTEPLQLQTSDESYASLQLVAQEVSTELNEARIVLEAFGERPEERGLIERFAAHLHLARGALRVAEVYGGALLAEEMEHVAQYVAAHTAHGKTDPDGLDALLRAMEQLPSYLDRVASGGRDVPLALLPLLNDLRAVRGSALLSEGTLLMLNLRSDEPARPIATGGGELAELARRVRPRFQVALLGLIRGENTPQQLAALSQIAEQLEGTAAAQPLFQLWWVVGAVLEALRDGGIENSVSIKRLLGHADREIKRLHDLGEQRCGDNPPVELLNNLLFYVARASSNGARVAGVRRSFGLDDLLPADDHIDEARETLSAPSVRLMKTVAAAIREDLTRVKDVLDIFVRRGATQVEDLVPQLEMLRKISDTLGVLGLGALRDRVQGEIESLRAIVDRRQPPDDTSLLGIAAALIEVEDSLDGQLVRLIVPEAMSSPDGEPADEEFRAVQEAVLRECIVNMARIKEAITQALTAPTESQGLDQVPQLVRGITAGLLMLGKQRAVEVMEGIGRGLGAVLRPGPEALTTARLERLADAIVAVEYYMEMLQAGRPDHWNMLSNAEAFLATLDAEEPKIVALRSVRPGERPTAPEPAVAPPEAAARPHAADAPEAVHAPPRAAPSATAFVPPTGADPEFVSLFVEEAREVIAGLIERAPIWEQNPAEVDVLREIRRGFHTLKGSGRMVGAQRIGEFSWSIESLLNRVLSQTLQRSPDIVEIVREALRVLPRLVDELEHPGTGGVDVAPLMARADAISGREATALPPLPAAPPVEQVAAPTLETDEDRIRELAEAASEEALAAPMDPVLQDIFRKEAAGHVAVLREFISACEPGAAPYVVTEALYRACHTLSGIAKTAGVRQGIKVAEPMEHYIRKLHESGHRLPEEGLALLKDTARSLENVVAHIDQDTGFFPDQRRLIVGWHALERALDTELASLAEAAERTVSPAELSDTELPAAEPSARESSAEEAISPTTGPMDTPSTVIEFEAFARAADDEELELIGDEGRGEEASGESPGGEEQGVGDVTADEIPADQAAAAEGGADDEIVFDDSGIVVEEGEFTALDIEADSWEPPTTVEFVDDSETVEESVVDRLVGGEPEAVAAPAFEPSPPESRVATESDSLEPASPPSRSDELIPVSAPAAEEPQTEFDPEIAAIFSEEASELLEQSDAALSAWRRDRSDRSHMIELKRLLHTLKGGARMAGIRSMGDLSHELESLLDSLEVGTVTDADAAIDVVQRSLDELHRLRDAASAGQPLPSVVELVARAHALGSGLPPVAAPPIPPAVAAGPDETAAVGKPSPAEVAPPGAPPAAQEPVGEPEPPARELEFEPPPEVEVPAPWERSIEPVSPAPQWRTELIEPLASSAAPDDAGGTAAQPVLPGREPVSTVERQELARVDAELLDQLLNNAGEVSIFRARVEQQMTSIEFNLAELGRTVTRLREQLRKLELETEAQILHRHQDDVQGGRTDFDPLELDRYSTIQQLSRALAESVSDVASIEGLLGNLNRDAQNLLLQQGRIVTELQNGLMRTRMVPFDRHVQRLTRIVRQAAQEEGKQVELVTEGAAGELDRQVLERMLPPFEHMLRNSVVHGIETPDERRRAGKPETGRIGVRLQREGAEVVITVEDDGAGLNVNAIRTKARQMGLLAADQTITDEEALQLILEPGFSTADRLTQQAGRGVGMDVVATEVKKLGGGLFIESIAGRGARFTIRLPFTLAITQALIVRVHEELFALPVATVEGVARLPRIEILRHIDEEAPSFEYGGQSYRFQYLGAFVGSGPSVLPESDVAVPVILVRAGEHSTALVTDELLGSREIVVKSLGPQIAAIRGISGATILGDGRIVVILDVGALVRSEWRSRPPDAAVAPTRDDRIFALVVDDSITVRRVTQRLLERNGMRVMTAKDGVDAMSLLQDHIPDVLLLDIEMPRMDGYEVAAHVRSDPRLADVPIIMITSRVGDKHRARAIELGVDDYLGKPYQESQLLDAIEPLVLARRQQIE